MTTNAPSKEDIEIARGIIAQGPEALATAISKIAAAIGLTVPADADEETLALAISEYRRVILLVCKAR